MGLPAVTRVIASKLMFTLIVSLIRVTGLTEGTDPVIVINPLQCIVDNSGANTSISVLASFNSTYTISYYTISAYDFIECERCTPGEYCQCFIERERVNVLFDVYAFSGSSALMFTTSLTIATACLVEDLGVLDDRDNSSCDQLMAGALKQSVNIGNGRSCINGTALGSVATYQCDRGYFLTVDDSRTCQCDGKWSEPVPKCIPSISSQNLGFLVSSVLLWIIAVLLSCVASIADMALLMYKLVVKKAKVDFKEAACLIIVSFGLDLLIVPCLILVIIFWALFGVNVGNPDSVKMKDSFIIVAFVFSLVAFIIPCIGLIATILPSYLKKTRKKDHTQDKVSNTPENCTANEMSSINQSDCTTANI